MDSQNFIDPIFAIVWERTTIILSHTLFITSTASGAVGIYNWGNRPSPYSFSTVPLLSNSIKHPDILSILLALDVRLAISPWCPSSFREWDWRMKAWLQAAAGRSLLPDLGEGHFSELPIYIGISNYNFPIWALQYSCEHLIPSFSLLIFHMVCLCPLGYQATKTPKGMAPL